MPIHSRHRVGLLHSQVGGLRRSTMLASDEALIHPALAASLSHGRCSSAHSITTQAYSCPVLSSTASVALEKESALSAAPCPRIELLPTLSCSDCPLVAHAAAYLGEHVMQHLVAAIFPDRPPLCDAKRAYLLRYGAGTVPDGGRTHRIHGTTAMSRSPSAWATLRGSAASRVLTCSTLNRRTTAVNARARPTRSPTLQLS